MALKHTGPKRRRASYAIKRERMWYSIWKRGELIGGREQDGSFYAVVQVAERVVGPRGVLQPAEAALITAPTERGVFAALRSLGFSVPRRLHLG